ncbi:MAG TPA: glycosyltransferase, partial [Flavisolibacter sp.]|nr:glycosyltransferase [Flavisolibacter sp.]
MRTQPDISVIVPFLNEECSLVRLGEELILLTEKNESLNFEIILVNDGSSDGSKKMILKNRFPEGTKLISLSRNFGSHAALRAGISRSTGRFITFLYADLQDPVENVLLLYKKIVCGSKNIAWAFRSDTHNGIFEKYFSRIYSDLMRKFVNKQYPLQGFDVVMFDAKVAAELNKNIESNSSIFLQILNLGFASDCIFYDKQLRESGKSKWTFGKKIKLLIDSFVGFSFAPIRLVSVIGIIFFIIGICWAAYIIFRKLVFNDLATGWPALLCVLMVGFGITNISLGIIAEYLWRTLDSSRKRPVFIIDEV